MWNGVEMYAEQTEKYAFSSLCIKLSGLYIVPYTDLQSLWEKNMKIFQRSAKTTVENASRQF